MFKNLYILRIAPTWTPSLDEVRANLEKARFTACGKTQDVSLGFIEPRGEAHAPLVESIGGQWVLKVLVECKLLPAAVVKEELAKRTEDIQRRTGRKPGKREMADLKDEVRQELLAKAFTKKTAAFVWIDPKSRLLAIDVSAKAKADRIASLLVKSIDGFGLNLINTKLSPAAAMATWLSEQEAPSPFMINQDCSLKDTGHSKASVRYAKHPLDIEEVRGHIVGGKQPTQLSLTWRSRVSFALTEAMTVKQIEFLDVVFEGADAESGFDADAAIATAEFADLAPDLIEALGGEDQPQDIVTPEGIAQGDDDPMLRPAFSLVVNHKSASISLVQRHLKIGYNRAARLLEAMEMRKLVSPMKGNGARDLIAESEEDFDTTPA